jgi:hypothetical protein
MRAPHLDALAVAMPLHPREVALLVKLAPICLELLERMGRHARMSLVDSIVRSLLCPNHPVQSVLDDLDLRYPAAPSLRCAANKALASAISLGGHMSLRR